MKLFITLSTVGLASAFPLVARQISTSATSSSLASAISSVTGSAKSAAASATATSAPGGNTTAQTNLTVYDYNVVPLNVSVPLMYNFTHPPLSGNPKVNGTNTTLAAPYLPAGGDNNPKPNYTIASNFDRQSFIVALNQELIELDLFNHGLAMFSPAEFAAHGIDAEQQHLLRFMAQQEIGHAIAISNMLGPELSPKQCVYQYPFTTVPEFIAFSQLLTRFGESGVLGFLPHLDNRASAQILLQSITTESRQQMIFRQMQGLFPMPVWFETGIPQAWAWTLLSPYIKSCPANNPRIEFNLFPTLNVTDQPATIGNPSAVSTNGTAASAPGRNVSLVWEAPGQHAGYNNSYVTSSTAKGSPKFVAWVSQLNVTYTPLTLSGNYSGSTIQPNGTVFPDGVGIVNGTNFIAIVDQDIFLTPYNLSLINNHTIAGPALYQSG